MFKSLRDRLAAWREKAEAEVAEEAAEAPAAPSVAPRAKEESAKVEAPKPSAAKVAPAKAPPVKAVPARPARAPVVGDSGRKIKVDKLEETLYDLEMALLESDVAFPVAKEIIDALADDLKGKRVARDVAMEKGIESALRDAITKAMTVPSIDLFEILKTHAKPLVIMFVGVNGTGKTTTIAKLAYHIQKRGYTCVVAAADTFRAGAIEQLEKHAEAVGFKLIKHAAGADPAAVAFDAVAHAKARGRDVVLIDTAGRMQTNQNLMDQMKKIKRVTDPDLVFYIGDALAGNDAIEQAKEFHEAVGLDGIVLTKIDADAKGGAALSIARTIGKPVVFISVGQGYDDIRRFSVPWMVDRLLGKETE